MTEGIERTPASIALQLRMLQGDYRLHITQVAADMIDNLAIRADRALSAAKEAAGELEALHKAKMIPPGSADILEMVKAEIKELEKQ